MLILFSGPLAALEFSDGFVRGLPPGQKNTAAFFTLENMTATPWTIVRVASPAAERVEMHQHKHRDGMMGMRELERLAVEPNSSVEFAPGGLHLMLIGLKQPLRENDQVLLQFFSDLNEEVSVTFPVISVINEHRHH
ncbi:MAG: copper(I)-binding protein [Paracoccaceae bacterium]|jgi:copper(I)-binding protein